MSRPKKPAGEVPTTYQIDAFATCEVLVRGRWGGMAAVIGYDYENGERVALHFADGRTSYRNRKLIVPIKQAQGGTP